MMPLCSGGCSADQLPHILRRLFAELVAKTIDYSIMPTLTRILNHITTVTTGHPSLTLHLQRGGAQQLVGTALCAIQFSQTDSDSTELQNFWLKQASINSGTTNNAGTL